MFLRRNFSFNQKNISSKDNQRKKNNNKNIIRLKNNFNNNNNTKNKIKKENIDEDISFYDNIVTLKNQIFSPENGEDIYIYNNNKKMEKKIKYEDEKNNYNFLTSRSIRNINNNIKNNKKTLILDLDETLVHSLFQPEKANNNIIKPDIYLKIFFNNKYQEIFVYKRPFLDIFLKEMNKVFNIYVFTASIEKYAKPLLDKLDKNNLIQKKFYRESCLLAEGKFIKDLNSLNLNLKLKDVIIIDNNPFSYKFNKNNGIPIKSWHYDKSDTELIKIIPLLKYLSLTEDVRKYIPFIVKNDEINFEQINLIINSNNKRIKNRINENKKEEIILQKQQKKLYKTINYNNSNEYSIKNNFINNHHNPETINFREPPKKSQIKNKMKNFNKKNNNTNSNIIYRNEFYRNNSNCHKNSSVAINFNSGEINNNINNSKNADNFFKSYNNFFIKNKYSFVINQEKEDEKNPEYNGIKKHCKMNSINLESQKSFEDYGKINNIINRYKSSKFKKKKMIPIGKKVLNKMNNKTSRIYKEYKTCKNNIINNNILIRHCSSYKNFTNNENKNSNTMKPLIKMNNNYIQLKKSSTIETGLDKNILKNNNFYRNNSYTSYNNKKMNNPYLKSIEKTNCKEMLIENNEISYENKNQKTERTIKNNKIINQNINNNINIKKGKNSNERNYFPKRKIKLKNILYRNRMNYFNQNMKSYSYSNFGGENI